MSTTNEDTSKPVMERRERPDLRNIFEAVVVLVTPFYPPGGEAHDYWAAQAVREAYPELDKQGLQIVLSAAVRVCRTRPSGKT